MKKSNHHGAALNFWPSNLTGPLGSLLSVPSSAFPYSFHSNYFKLSLYPLLHLRHGPFRGRISSWSLSSVGIADISEVWGRSRGEPQVEGVFLNGKHGLGEPRQEQRHAPRAQLPQAHIFLSVCTLYRQIVVSFKHISQVRTSTTMNTRSYYNAGSNLVVAKSGQHFCISKRLGTHTN